MNTLEISLKERIIALHSDIVGSIKDAFDKSIVLGELLSKQKKFLKHGAFETWILNNLPFSTRTARNYMVLYKNRGVLKTENVSDLSSAYSLLKDSGTQLTIGHIKEAPKYPRDGRFVDMYLWASQCREYLLGTPGLSNYDIRFGLWEIQVRLERAFGKLINKFQEQFGKEATELITDHLGEFYFYLMDRRDTPHVQQFDDIPLLKWSPPEYAYDLIDLKACLLWVRDQNT